MNFQIKNFFDYLNYIGLTSEDTSPIITKLFSDKYNDLNKSSAEIDNLLTSLMCDYLKLLKEDQLILIGKNIYQQFSKNKLMTKMKHLKKVMHINDLYNKRILKRYLNKWRLYTIHLMTFNDNNNKAISYDKNEYYNNNVKNFKEKKNSCSVSSLNINNFLNKLDFYNSIRIKKKIKIKKLNDDDIISNCTFSPNLHLTKERNKRFLSNNNEESNIKRLYNKENIHNLLYNDYKSKDKAIEVLSKKVYDKFTFSPRINTNNEYIKKIQDNFFERNQKMINRKKELYGIFVENQKLNKTPSSRHKFLQKSFSTKKI